MGSSSEINKETITGLHQLLADSFLLYFKTWSFHWNIKADNFIELHKLFETQYTELAEAIDEIAERIRALGNLAQGNLSTFVENSNLQEANGSENKTEMMNQLINDHESIISTCKKIIPHLEKNSDQASMDIIARRLLSHEKNTWILKSFTA